MSSIYCLFQKGKLNILLVIKELFKVRWVTFNQKGFDWFSDWSLEIIEKERGG